MDKLIEVLYDDGVPIAKFLQFRPDFKVQRSALQTMLFTEQPTTPEDVQKLTENAASYVEMLIAGKVLVQKDQELTADENFQEFVKKVASYIDVDNMIIRDLGISRQDFDEIAREFAEVCKEVTDVDTILETWELLDPQIKMGIVRGILFQRSIMAGVVQTSKERLIMVMRHEQETLNWLNQVTK